MEASPMDLAQGDLPRPSIFEDLSPITDVPNLPVDFPPSIIPTYVDDPIDRKKIKREQYLNTPEGGTRLANYKRDLIQHINSYVNQDGEWEYNEIPDDVTEGDYHISKVKLLRGLKLLDPKKYPIDEDLPENLAAGVDIAESYYGTPYLTKSQEQLNIMKDIHEQTNFSQSALHNQLNPPPTSENLEGYMEILGKHDAGLRRYFDAGGDED